MVTFAIVVAILVVLSTVSYYVIWPPEELPNGGDGPLLEPYPWQLPTDAQEVVADTTWTGRTGVLDAPVRVDANATLRLVGCNVTVMLEDLVFWNRPAFDIGGGGALVIEDSSITIFRDPRFERSVIFNYWGSFTGVTYIARPVNLTEAIDPVLHLDVSWWGGGSPLAVGVLPHWGTRVTVLHEIEPGTPRHHEWRSYEVSLRAYKGTVPWVVVFAMRPQTDMAFIGNVSVRDGAAPPHGDAFPTGDPLEDGWSARSIYEPGNFMNAYGHGRSYTSDTAGLWQGLITSDGEVDILGSRLLAPPGLPRRLVLDYEKEQMDPDEVVGLDYVGCQGGHVQVNHSRLVIEGSELENVPIVTNGTRLEVSDARIVGDCDLLSLESPWGFLEGTTLVARDPAEFLYDAIRMERYIWSVGVRGSSPARRLRMTDCSFEGGDQAIDLSHADVEMSGCSFDGVDQYVIWDHSSVGLGDWSSIASTNTFTRCPRNLLLRTGTVELEAYVPEGSVSRPGQPDSAWVHSDLEVYNNISYKWSTFQANRTRLIVPEVLVYASFKVAVAKAPSVWLEWAQRHLEVPIEPGVASMRVDISKDPEAEWWVDVHAPIALRTIERAPGGGPGCYTVEAQVDLRDLVALNITLDILLDGGLLRRIDFNNESEYQDDWGDWYYIEQNVTLEGGWHELNASISGEVPLDMYTFSDVPTLIDGSSFRLLMVGSAAWSDDGRGPFDADRVLLESGGSLLLRPDASAVGSTESLELKAVCENGTRIRIDGSGLHGIDSLSVQVMGNVSLEVQNITADTLQLMTDGMVDYREVKGFDTALWNCTCAHFYFFMFGETMTAENLVVTDGAYFDSYGTCDISFIGCSFAGWGLLGTVQGGSLEMEGCTLEEGAYGGMQVTTMGACDFAVRDCTFNGGALKLLRNGLYLDEHLGVEVEGCTFRGDGAFLYVGVGLNDMTNYDGMPWTVMDATGRIVNNTFEGPGTGALLHHGLYAALFGTNTMGPGARLYAHYIAMLMVIHGDSRPPRPDSWAVIEGGGVTASYPFTIVRDFDADGEVLLDVTGDTNLESSPPPVPIIYGSPKGDGLIVMGFSTIDLLANNGEVTYSAAPDWSALLEPLVSG